MVGLNMHKFEDDRYFLTSLQGQVLKPDRVTYLPTPIPKEGGRVSQFPDQSNSQLSRTLNSNSLSSPSAKFSSNYPRQSTACQHVELGKS